MAEPGPDKRPKPTAPARRGSSLRRDSLSISTPFLLLDRWRRSRDRRFACTSPSVFVVPPRPKAAHVQPHHPVFPVLRKTVGLTLASPASLTSPGRNGAAHEARRPHLDRRSGKGKSSAGQAPQASAQPPSRRAAASARPNACRALRASECPSSSLTTRKLVTPNSSCGPRTASVRRAWRRHGRPERSVCRRRRMATGRRRVVVAHRHDVAPRLVDGSRE